MHIRGGGHGRLRWCKRSVGRCRGESDNDNDR
jgi:hypothetical protein